MDWIKELTIPSLPLMKPFADWQVLSSIIVTYVIGISGISVSIWLRYWVIISNYPLN
ncbi:hypothetical protein [Vulcanisaeta sp. JCM 16159]|uniref:hypothetical protein n=1 Tax=Vulcanisaeta sp. JCM 16159 TaxID=1295371 RepID=UPI000A5AE6F4|nr:hypothetical protein [Vulcanisaeta sp. JCM 16159]